MRPLVVAGILCVAAECASPNPVRARGWSLSEFSARESGLAGCGLAAASEESAAAWNPALLSNAQHGGGISLGASAIFLQISYDYPPGAASPSGGRSDDAVSHAAPVPALSAFARRPGGWAIGLATTSPFAASIEWGAEALGEKRRSSLSVIQFEPSLARAFGPLSLAIGFVYQNVEMKSFLDRPQVRAFQFERKGSGATARIALDAQLSETAGVSLSVRGADRIHLAGPATLWTVFGIASTVGDLDLTLPAEAAIAARLRAGGVLFTPQVTWTGWSVNRQLTVTYRPSASWPDTRPRDVANLDWHDTVRAGFGVEVAGPAGVSLRGGYAFDPSPIPVSSLSPTSLDLDKHQFALGAGKAISGMTVDLALQLWWAPPTSVRHETAGNEALAGTYQATYELVSLGMRYAW